MLLLKETSTDSELFKGTFWGISGTYEGTNHLGESFQFSLTGHEVWESILEHAEWAGVDVAATDSYRGRYENIPASGGYYGATWNDVAFWRPLSWLIGLGAPLEGYATLSKLYQAWGVVEEVTDDITDIGHPLGDYHRAYPVIRLPGQFGYIYKSTWSFVAPRAPQRW